MGGDQLKKLSLFSNMLLLAKLLGFLWPQHSTPWVDFMKVKVESEHSKVPKTGSARVG
jgi:hypothetical protein